MRETLDDVLRFVRAARDMGAVAVQVGDVSVRFAERQQMTIDPAELLAPQSDEDPAEAAKAEAELMYWSAE